MEESDIPFEEAAGEGAFYGPKIDFQIKSAIGREFSASTNQLDFAVPPRFHLEYTAEDGARRTPFCIHRAPLGTHERFVGFLLEHFGGLFPLWLAPVQVAIVPLAPPHEEYGAKVLRTLKEQGVRAVSFDSSETLGKRIRDGEKRRIPYLLVLGEKEEKEGSVTLRSVQTKKQLTVSLGEFVESVLRDIRGRTLQGSLG